MNCSYCNHVAVKNGKDKHADGTVIQTYLCQVCDKCFSERTATPMAFNFLERNSRYWWVASSGKKNDQLFE